MTATPPTPEAPLQLEQLMDWSLEVIRPFVERTELTDALLILQSPGLLPQLIVIRSNGGEGYALGVHKIISETTPSPSAVVLIAEAWHATVDPKVDDADFERFENGEIQVRDLPPSKRDDMLLVVGESNEGVCLDRYFLLETQAPGLMPARVLREYLDQTDYAKHATRFRPLFPSNDGRDAEGNRVPWSEVGALREEARTARRRRRQGPPS